MGERMGFVGGLTVVGRKGVRMMAGRTEKAVVKAAPNVEKREKAVKRVVKRAGGRGRRATKGVQTHAAGEFVAAEDTGVMAAVDDRESVLSQLQIDNSFEHRAKDISDDGEDVQVSTRSIADDGEEVQVAKRSNAYRDSLTTYLKEMRQFELLERAEEVDLARKVQAQAVVEVEKKRLAKDLQRSPTFTEWATYSHKTPTELRQIVIDGTLAKQTLVEANLRLVQSVVTKFRRGHGGKVDSSKFQDLLQEGMLGLIRAAEKYDAERGFRFSTYATHWILSTVSRAVNKLDRMVRLPSEIQLLGTKLNKVRREYVEKHGKEPREIELARLAGVTPAKLRFVLSSLRKRTISMDVNVSGNDSEPVPLGELLSSDEDLEEELVDNMLRRDLDTTMRKLLQPRERAALRLRYGLDDGAERTLREIGQALNLSSERTRQILFDAIVKLRRHSGQGGLSEYLPQLG